MSDPLDLCAGALFTAWQDRVPLASLDEWLTPGDLAAAYAVQDRLDARMREAGRVQVGWKVGVTSPVALAAMGATEPIAGRIYADSVLAAPARFAPEQGCEPRLEGEVLLELGHDALAAASDDAALAAMVVSVRPAFEIADARVAGWPRDVAHAIADNALCGWLCPAAEGRAAERIDFAAVAMTMDDGAGTVSAGTGKDCLGDVRNSLRWFLDHARTRGLKVERGQWLLTGALGPAVPPRAGARYRVALSGLGEVTLETTAEERA